MGQQRGLVHETATQVSYATIDVEVLGVILQEVADYIQSPLAAGSEKENVETTHESTSVNEEVALCKHLLKIRREAL